nr:unnamed protein product [Callosobruchus analis]
MTPYKNDGYLTDAEIKYNTLHSKARSSTESCLGLLKTKFRRLRYLEINKTESIPVVICAACVLHNFIILHEGYNEHVLDEFEPEIVFIGNISPIEKSDQRICEPIYIM